MPLNRELDPSAGPLEFFGAELRRARIAAELSQELLGKQVGYSGAQVGKVETGERAVAGFSLPPGVAPCIPRAYCHAPSVTRRRAPGYGLPPGMTGQRPRPRVPLTGTWPVTPG